LEARLQACRDLVNPLLDASPIKDSSPTKELLLSPSKSPEKSDILSDLPIRYPPSRPQSQLSNHSDRYTRPIQTPRTPSGSRRLTFGRPISRQSENIEDEGDITITLENTSNITPRRPNRHNKTISTTSRPDSRLSIRSVSQDDEVFKRPESATGRQSATGRRTSGIPAPTDRRTSGIPAPRRQSGIPTAPRSISPTRSTSSSSFHSDTPQSIISPSTSAGSMGAPQSLLPRRQSGAQPGLPVPKSSLLMNGRKSMGIPVPKS